MAFPKTPEKPITPQSAMNIYEAAGQLPTKRISDISTNLAVDQSPLVSAAVPKTTPASRMGIHEAQGK